jgi:hypothetical protein
MHNLIIYLISISVNYIELLLTFQWGYILITLSQVKNILSQIYPVLLTFWPSEPWNTVQGRVSHPELMW